MVQLLKTKYGFQILVSIYGQKYFCNFSIANRHPFFNTDNELLHNVCTSASHIVDLVVSQTLSTEPFNFLVELQGSSALLMVW
jgi:hypothetical protein